MASNTRILLIRGSTMTSPSKDHSTDYYYFVAAVAAIALLLLASKLVAVGCCSRCGLLRAIKRFLRSGGVLSGSAEDEPISQLIPACKYKKEQAGADCECSVCLMPFVDGEEVRQLPECKHWFHAPCIDMWLYSHSNCPMCRAGVLPEALQCSRAAAGAREEAGQSRRGLSETRGMTGVVIGML